MWYDENDVSVNGTPRQEIYYDIDERYDSNFTSGYTSLSAIIEMTMCSYVYFIPRMIAFRCVTIGEEKKKAHFWPMTYLMVVVLAASVSNVCRCFKPSQHVFVFIIFISNCSVNFLNLISIFGEAGYDDKHREQNIVIEIIIPIITFLIYNTVRARFRKERYYERASGTDDGKPNIVDRMGKIVWYGAIIAVFSSLARLAYDPENDVSDGVLEYFLNADTPVITVVAYLSVLRKSRPTRPCFLLCCTEEDVGQPITMTRVGISG